MTPPHNVKRLSGLAKAGAIIIYPTDTVYGIGCDATNPRAVARLRKAKQRPDKPFSVIAPTKKWVRDNCSIDKEAEKWLHKLPGPYTLILKMKRQCVAKNVSTKTLGVRLISHWFQRVVKKTGKPFVTTSANVSGRGHGSTKKDFALLAPKVDEVIFDGALKNKPSQVVDLTRGLVLRR